MGYKNLFKQLFYVIAFYWVFATHAQAYPDRPIKIIVPFPVGGTSDIIARIVSDKLSQELKQPIIIENKSGGNGQIGTKFVQHSNPDGYTLLFGSSSTNSLNPLIHQTSTNLDSNYIFDSIGLVASMPNVLVTNKQIDAKDVKGFINLAKNKQMSGASGATMQLLNIRLFEQLTDTSFNIISYKGSSAALVDVIRGENDFMFDQLATSLGYIKDGKLHALAVTGRNRSPLLNTVPTMIESGLPTFIMNSWWGLFAPVGTSQTTINRLNSALNKTLTSATIIKKINSMGGSVKTGSPENLATLVQEDKVKWLELIKARNLNLQY